MTDTTPDTVVGLTVESGVAVISLNSPSSRNALTPDLTSKLLDICADIDNDDDIGVTIIRGTKESFCSGASIDDLESLAEDPATDAAFRYLGKAYEASTRLAALKTPTIAAVRGAAVGAGFNLMLAADLRIVSENARILSGFSRIGLHPGGGHFALMARLAAFESVVALGIFGVEIDGRRARELGIAWASLADEEVDDSAMEIALPLGKDPELSRASIKSLRLEIGPPALPWAAAIEMERGVQMWSLRRLSKEVEKSSRD